MEKVITLGDKMENGRAMEKSNMREKDGDLNQRRSYEKKLTVLVEIEGEERVTMMELLKKVREECGVVIGCRYKTPREYELTMEEEKGKEKLLDGLRIKNSRVMAKEVDSMEMVVSFLGLPTTLREWNTAAMDKENSDGKGSDLYEVEEEEESEEVEGATTGEEERRGTCSEEEGKEQRRVTESMSSQDKVVLVWRRREREREKRKRGERSQERRWQWRIRSAKAEKRRKQKARMTVWKGKAKSSRQEVTESPMASQDREMDTSDGKRVRRKRKKKETEEHTAESKCLD
ncbi:hypothetical protein DPX16_20863 [Anabarilius grahami]|uniref:Uncharacterized protein n=1 Tax=Anabarilius grahami TaxID=495550 RepID=A0A3N0YEJ8_ANAGA|nr:hypothetical protein DPX16_20863 [Anabarilius grahami]